MNKSPNPSQSKVITPNENTIKENLPQILLIIGLLIFFVGGGYLLYSQYQKDEPREVPPITVSPTPEEISESQSYYGKNTETFEGTGDIKYSGSVTRTVTKTYASHSVSASLPELEEGKFYQAWQIDQYSGLQFPFGILKEGPIGKYTLESIYHFENENVSKFDELYNIFAISIETDNDNIIEEKIIEVQFTQ